MKTFYDLLEVSPAASDEVIKAAYRVLSNRYHPDKNTDTDSATQAMVTLNRAYAILSDPNQRKAYDAVLAVESRRARSSAKRSPPSTETNADTVKNTGSFSPAHSYTNLPQYLAIAAFALFVVALIYAVAPAGSLESRDFSPAAFKDPPDPYMLRMNKGEALLSGNGSSQNFLQAKAEFEAIAGTKDVLDVKGYRGRACQRLGEMYLSGFGVPKNTVKAEEWFRQAAEYGRVVGPAPALSVARFFEEGTNGTQDMVEAYRWYNVAAGTSFDIDKAAISRGTYDELVSLAKKKRDELGAKLSMEDMNRAQRSPLPPCKSFSC